MPCLWLASVLATALQAPPPDADVEILARDLRGAIEMPDPRERRAAVAALAKSRPCSIDVARRAIDAVRARAPVAPGTHVETAAIWADGRIEDTELVVNVPKTYDATRPAPLLLTFHGTGGSGRGADAPWRATAAALGMLVVAPSESGPNAGYGWTQRERDVALGALRWTQVRFQVDAQRVFVSGISRGGHLAWDVALRHSDRFAALAPFIGSPRFQVARDQNNLRFLENLVDVPIRDLQGARDDEALVENVREGFATLAKLGARDARLIEFEDRGHDFDFGAVDWVLFLGSARRVARPASIVLTAADLGSARASWVEILRFDERVAVNPRIEVRSAEWSRLDARGQRRAIEAQIDAQTARLEIALLAPGRFRARDRGVASLRLLLDPSMFDPAVPIEIEFGGKRLAKKVRPDVRVLWSEFVERLDPAFLPVAAVDVP